MTSIGRKVAIVAAVRTPVGAFGGSLKDISAARLASTAMKEVLKRANIDPALIGDVRMGCCIEHYKEVNVARVAALLSGVPEKVPGVTMNRVCCSGMEALHSGFLNVAAGFSDVILCGGVESMSNAPYMVPGSRWGIRLQDSKLIDAMIHGLMVGSTVVPYPKDGPIAMMRGQPYIMGLTAEFLAHKHRISREEMDEVALRSHNNVERATVEGLLKDEIVPVEVTTKKGTVIVDKDEHFRPGLKLQQLENLKPTFIPNIGTVTAGNSSGINDGAAALMLVALDKCKELGVKPLAIISGIGRGGCAPELMGESPIPAVQDLMQRTGHQIKDFDRVEMNEAFAAQYLACERSLKLNREVTNVNGSGIGIGHPVGCTGARITVSLLHELMRSGKRRGMASMCGGGGVSLATELEMCD